MVQSNLWITTALLSLLVTRAFHVPFFRPAEEASPHLLSDIYSYPDAEDSTSLDAVSIEDAKWACDVRSWVRAPDLKPDSVIPAEARLAVNGSACGDIVGWDVGLRFKERAIVKIRSKNTELPKRPIQPRMNASMYAELDRQRDWNDVYFVGGPYTSPYQEFEEKLEEYNLAMKNQSLWTVKASERVVFDLSQTLQFKPTNTWPNEASSTSEVDQGPDYDDAPLGADPRTWGPPLDTEVINQVQSFFVHVPSTNFPPITSTHWNGMDQGQHEQMVNTETLLEYYHLIHLKNGTTLDIPAGQSGFLPDPIPWKQDGAGAGLSYQTERAEWPATVQLASPRSEGTHEEDEEEEQGWRSWETQAPDCDKDNLAEFQVEVTADDVSFVQGQNVTLNVTLTRSGNGTEYPTFLQARLRTARNVTWVYNFISSDEEYQSLVESRSGRRGGRSGIRRSCGPGDGKWMEMLQVPSDEELDNRRKEMEDNEKGEGVHCTVYGGFGGRWPLAPQEMGTRYDIEADQELGNDVYHFQVHLPILWNDFPSFETTFQTLQPIITFDLRTTFLCEPDRPYYGDMPTEDDDGAPSEDGEDKEWTEYNLPYRPKEKKKLRNGRSLVHYGSVPVHVSPSPSRDTSMSTAGVVHYLDGDARAPALSLDADKPSTSSFTKLNHVLTEEKSDHLRKSRYHDRESDVYDEPNQRPRNPGGRWMHAASLWQRKELDEKKKASVGRATNDALSSSTEAAEVAAADEPRFVVQH
ncbi:hypothetical protein I316_07905 [Kwoniella heveanensis BCC8398]|uniref:Uncharacterized protein n=1 Tax=Kwoniella heveanensis BCC8398 TaxID=1296120 RepID=A0A1B9GHE8_9TREE|nr:hypothetical protein I316_07905 [Kwoniella heveanensis BCC8398]